MSTSNRLRFDFAGGTLSQDAEVADQTLVSTAFASLQTITSPQYMPIILNPLGSNPEIVWITSHTLSSASVTVSRAAEQSDSNPAVFHQQGETWYSAPTALDFDGRLMTGLSTGLPSISALDVGMALWEVDAKKVVVWDGTTWNVIGGSGGSSGVLLDTSASHIQPLGTQAAGGIGKAADSGHVHPTTGVVLSTSLPTSVVQSLTVFSGGVIGGGDGSGHGNLGFYAAEINGYRFLANNWYTSRFQGAASVTLGAVSLVQNQLYLIPFDIPQTHTFNGIGVNVTGAGGTGASVQLGVFADVNSSPATTVITAGPIPATSTGNASVTLSNNLASGRYWLGVVTQGASVTPTLLGLPADSGLGSYQLGSTTIPSSGQAIVANDQIGWYQTNVTGAFPTTITTSGALLVSGALPLVWLQA